jgi:cation:H+ antiporter
MTALLLLSGLALLIAGAELLVRGASRLAATLGISPLVIGLTVVAFGTSSPELAVSVKAVLSDQPALVLGPVVGSNIFNVLFILGLSALIVPLAVAQQLVRLDVPLMAGLSVLLLVLSLDRVLGRGDGLLLVAGLVLYLWFLVSQSRRESAAIRAEYESEYGVEKTVRTHWWKNAGMVVLGLALLVAGSRWLVEGAVGVAQALGVSELVIGLTIVAAGTSMPEVVTSVVAAIRGERDIAVGNVVGSNLFNIMGVLGIASIVAPAGVAVPAEVLRVDLPVMILVALACVPIFFTGRTVSRPEGFLFLGSYLAYTLFLVLAAT